MHTIIWRPCTWYRKSYNCYKFGSAALGSKTHALIRSRSDEFERTSLFVVTNIVQPGWVFVLQDDSDYLISSTVTIENQRGQVATRDGTTSENKLCKGERTAWSYHRPSQEQVYLCVTALPSYKPDISTSLVFNTKRTHTHPNTTCRVVLGQSCWCLTNSFTRFCLF